MQPEPFGSWRWIRRHPNRAVLAAWVLVLLVVGVRTFLRPGTHSCYPIFSLAARSWQNGEDLYCTGQLAPRDIDYYRYSPLVAALFMPLSLFPDQIGGFFWRILSASALLAGLAWFGRAVLPFSLNRAQLALLFLLVLPLSIGNLNNGQANALVLGLVLLTVAAVVETSWKLAAVCMALACLFKIYPLAVGLLLVSLYPRQLAARLGLALAVGLVLPFFLQRPGYVASQYAHWTSCLAGDDRSGLEICYRDFQLLFRVWLAPLSLRVFRVVEVVAGAAMALLCLVMRRTGDSERRLLTFTTALGCCWMTVFGPATESSTYIFIAPTLACALLAGWALRQPLWLRALLSLNYLFFLIAYMEAWFPGGGPLRRLGLQPFAALLLLVNVLMQEWWGRSQRMPELSQGTTLTSAQAA